VIQKDPVNWPMICWVLVTLCTCHVIPGHLYIGRCDLGASSHSYFIEIR